MNSTMLRNLNFDSLELNSRKQIVFGRDIDDRYFIKIELESNPNKAKNLAEEYEIIKGLNLRGCRSCPIAHEFGTITKEFLLDNINNMSLSHIKTLQTETYNYIIQDYIPHSDQYALSDIVFSMLEQRKLGIYQGDIKPANIRFDRSLSVCYIIDYDQSVILDNKKQNIDNLEFLDFCSEYDKNKFGFGDWLRHFNQYSQNDISSLFQDSSFDLGKTTIFNKQRTTNSNTGFYHTIRNKELFIDGSRTLAQRATALNQLKFSDGERVLDVGCNTGLLCEYLYDRGCKASGFDNDTRIPIAAKMVYNILGKNIDFYHLDLDEVESLPQFDTVMLFSVLHHTQNIEENALKVANCCRRIILESKLEESGKQPNGNSWAATSQWKLENIDQLAALGERLFPKFKLNNNLGQVDKHRYILEFVKE